MAVGQSPRFRRRRLGEELRAVREAKRFTLQQLAAELGWSHTKLSRLENAKVRPDVGDIMDILEVLGVSGDQERRLVALARQAKQRGWWRAYADMPERQAGVAELESGATEIWEYAQVFVPGLLQTEKYARVRCADRDAFKDFDIEAAVAGRRERQQILTADPPVTYTVVLDEATLRRVTAPADVWHGQCIRLVEIADLPNIRLHVLPFSAGLAYHAAPLNPFSMYSFASNDEPDIVGVETETNELHLGDEDDVARYRVVRQRIMEAALDSAESLLMIKKEMRP
jgi:transcriptional regulator with XRE-family HTH domain